MNFMMSLINDGQPCYRSEEKLWRKFHEEEGFETHLKCELEINGKLTDNRYENQGNITYDEIYEDNLSKQNYDLIKDRLKGENVSLFKREFLGIDRNCDEKMNITKEKYDNFQYAQTSEKFCTFAEGIIIISLWFPLLIMTILWQCFNRDSDIRNKVLFFFFLFFMLLIIICMICHGIFLVKIKAYDLSYKCSDETTNELLRLENENTKSSILYTSISLGIDIFVLSVNIIALFIAYLWQKYESYKLGIDLMKNPSDLNKIEIDNTISKKQIKEVIVNNGTPPKIEHSKSSVNYNNNNVPHLIHDFEVIPPNVTGSVSSNKY